MRQARDPFEVKLNLLAEFVEGRAEGPYGRHLSGFDASPVVRDNLVLAMVGRINDSSLLKVRACQSSDSWRSFDAFWDMFAEGGTAVSVDELRLLRYLASQLPGNGTDERVRQFRLRSPDESLPAYAFDAGPPAPAEFDDAVAVYPSDQVQRVVRAYRRPANPAARQPPAWVYVVEVDPPDLMYHLQDRLLLPAPEEPGPHPPGCLVEVVARDQVLPPYHRDALATGRLIWRYGEDLPTRGRALTDFSLDRAAAMVAARLPNWASLDIVLAAEDRTPSRLAFHIGRGGRGAWITIHANGDATVEWDPPDPRPDEAEHLSPLFRLDCLLDRITDELRPAPGIEAANRRY